MRVGIAVRRQAIDRALAIEAGLNLGKLGGLEGIVLLEAVTTPSNAWWTPIVHAAGPLLGATLGAVSAWWLLTRKGKQEQAVRLQNAYASFCAKASRMLALNERYAMLQEQSFTRFMYGKDEDLALDAELTKAGQEFRESTPGVAEAGVTLLMYERDTRARARLEALMTALEPLLSQKPNYNREHSGDAADGMDECIDDTKAATRLVAACRKFVEESSRLPQLG